MIFEINPVVEYLKNEQFVCSSSLVMSRGERREAAAVQALVLVHR